MSVAENLMDTIGHFSSTRADVAADYAAAIVYDAPVDWPAANRAIIDKWSKSALVWIKREAWKRAQAHPHYRAGVSRG